MYDTQCGAKMFRDGPALRDALREPFGSRWFFDVELLGRLYRGSPLAVGLPLEAFVEMPLNHWRDVPGSKLRPLDFPKSFLELYRIRQSLRRRPGGIGAAPGTDSAVPSPTVGVSGGRR